MKISCLIDSLNSGGAQRQFCLLAVGLKKAGFDVEIITYHQFGFFLSLLDQEEIKRTEITSKTKFHRILNVRRAIRNSHPDIVISYLNTPNILAELSGFPIRNFKLIVSERNTDYKGTMVSCSRKFLLHLLADAVVANSYAQAEIIKRIAPWLQSRLATIPNCVDLEKFHPEPEKSPDTSDRLKILVLGRFEQQKNPIFLLSAIETLVKKYRLTNLVVDWYGNNFFIDGKPTSKSSLFLKLQEEIRQRSLENHFRLHPPDKEVVNLYHSASLLCLPSLFEGCSNVVCEAMACGKPVLASRVGDNEILVEEGVNGFLFSPESPQEIIDKVLKFEALSSDKRQEMGRNSRAKAEERFSIPQFIEQYLVLFEKILKPKNLRESV